MRLSQIGQRRIGDVMGGGFGFAIVIAREGGDDGTVASVKTRNVAVEREIFAVLVMALMADGVADVVEQRAGFEQHAGLRRQVMHRLQTIEKKNAEFANVLGVHLILFRGGAQNFWCWQ